MGPHEACHLAAELAVEYGPGARDFAQRAAAAFAADGDYERAALWHALEAILGDIAARRIDPHAVLTLH